jgi:hypothetical protein
MSDAGCHATLGLDKAYTDVPVPLEATTGTRIAALQSVYETRHGHDLQSE